MKAKTLETLLARETPWASEMPTRFQALRDANPPMISNGRGRNAGLLSTDEVVTCILSIVSERPSKAAWTCRSLRNLRPVSAEISRRVEGNFGSALRTLIEDEALLKSVTAIKAMDTLDDPEQGLPNYGAIFYDDGVTNYYAVQTVLTALVDPAPRIFKEAWRETVIKGRLLQRVAREMKSALADEKLEQMVPTRDSSED